MSWEINSKNLLYVFRIFPVLFFEPFVFVIVADFAETTSLKLTFTKEQDSFITVKYFVFHYSVFIVLL